MSGFRCSLALLLGERATNREDSLPCPTRLIRVPSIPMRLLLPLLLAVICPVLAAEAAPAVQDVVLLTNGQRITGTIDDTVVVRDGSTAIRTRGGVLVMRRELIERVEESYATRRAKVSDNDAAGLYALARWCLTKGLRDEAATLLALAVAVLGCPIEAHALYARLVDELQGPEASIPLYRAYRTAGGVASEPLARLKQLEDLLADHEKVANTPVEGPAKPAVNDGMEARAFTGESVQYFNACEVQVVKVTTEDGTNQVLRLTFHPGDKEKAAAKRPLPGISVKDTPMLTLYASNPTDKPVNLAIALKTGEYVWHESPTVAIPPGKGFVEVHFNLLEKNFKIAPDWTPNAPMAHLDDVKELLFLVYNGKTEGELLLDGIDFKKKEL